MPSEGDLELQRDEVLCLESLLSPEEFRKSDENASGILEICPFFELGITAIIVDSPPKVEKLNEWLNTEDQEDKTKLLNEDFKGLHSHLSYLPPIQIHFHYPEGYPSHCSPEIRVTACWIPRRLVQQLEHRVKVLWDQNGHQAVLFEFFQSVSDLAASFRLFPFTAPCLPIFSRESFSQSNETIAKMESNYLLLVPHADNFLRSLQHYDDNRTVVLFQQNTHRCNVCFDTHPGTDFIRLTNCRHFVCKACMKGLCDSLIRDGSVQKLQCLECSEELNPFDIEASVDPVFWSRYQKFQLDNALSLMEDVVYCPRPWCNQAVLKEGQSDAGRCPGCAYVFCVNCRRGYHGIEPCPLDGEKRLIVDEYEKADSQTKLSMEKRYGKTRLKNLGDEIKAEDWVSQNSKPCPKCKFPVEKMGGCNKMLCTKCASPFCWICMAKLPIGDPYGHYQDPANKSCYMNLMLGMQIDDQDNDEEEDVLFGDDAVPERWFDAFGADHGEVNGRLILDGLREFLNRV
ncbi:E3 ubiquitin-protein ligase RNF14-like [Paramacrobiotus metropolitanus]|uniref:E3 ubiquitin-protein ligase RNF14-like n=1 Tax=Paramacrobiotus metropolitanus TaxID=2943436 RepID=UPI0024461625|nr:E3 ubiquitin-protein ligase RNF14-like [Paramacrobiotus metropolitanus]